MITIGLLFVSEVKEDSQFFKLQLLSEASLVLSLKLMQVPPAYHVCAVFVRSKHYKI